MKLLFRNIIALFFGVLIGMIMSMGITMLGWKIFSFPENINPIIDIMPSKYYLFPFLAHSIGTFSGSFLGCKISKDYNLTVSLFVGIWFLIVGIYAVLILPTPIWFIIIDITLCYIPMAYSAWLIQKNRLKLNR